MREPLAVRLVRYVLIAGAVIVGPLYALWIAGGWFADRRGQRRRKPETAARRHRAF